MKLINNFSNTNPDIVPVGFHIARCCSVIELGSKEQQSNGASFTSSTMVAQFEILDWQNKSGKNPVINQFYTVSANPGSHLRKHMEIINEAVFTKAELQELETDWLIGRYCMLNIFHSKPNGSIFGKIDSLLPIHPSTEKPDPVRNDVYFCIDEPDFEVFCSIPEWLQKMIQQSLEWKNFPKTGGWEIFFNKENCPDSPIAA